MKKSTKAKNRTNSGNFSVAKKNISSCRENKKKRDFRAFSNVQWRPATLSPKSFSECCTKATSIRQMWCSSTPGTQFLFGSAKRAQKEPILKTLFWLNFLFLTKNIFYDQNLHLRNYELHFQSLTRISCFDQIYSCFQSEFLFLTRTSIFDQNFCFWSKFLFSTKISIFTKILFWVKFLFFLFSVLNNYFFLTKIFILIKFSVCEKNFYFRNFFLTNFHVFDWVLT